MKKLLLLLLLFSSYLSNSQVARKVLFESFSGENCGPCASQNPIAKAIIDANPTKVIMCKYQVAIPSAGAICNLWQHNGTAGASQRQSFYTSHFNMSGFAPMSFMDGSYTDPTVSGNNRFYPSNLKQTNLDARAAITSPLRITVSHVFNSDVDSIDVTYAIKNELPTSLTGSYVVNIALVEEKLTYATAPGTNGEKEFHNVVRYMHTNPLGNTFTPPMPSATTNGTAKFAVPSYIRDSRLLRVIVWVQNTTTKEVVQAEISNKVTSPNYINECEAKFDITTANPGLCATTFIPKIRLYNYGTMPISNVKVKFGISGSQAYIHSTPIPAGDSSAVITLAPVTLVANATNVITLSVPASSGLYGKSASLLTTSTTVASLPFLETFESAAIGSQVFKGVSNFPSNMAFSADKSVSQKTYNAGGFEASNKSLLIIPYRTPFYNGSYSMYFDKVSMAGLASTETVKFYFSYAAAVGDADDTKNNDSFFIEGSKDCGTTYTTLKKYSIKDMHSYGGGTYMDPGVAVFFPKASEWRKDSVDMSPLKGNASVMMRARYKTGGVGSEFANLFSLDDFNMKKSTGSATGTTSKIMEDTTIKKLFNASTLTANNQEVKSFYNSNVSIGDDIRWRLINQTLPSNWSTISVCDHDLCLPYAVNLTNDFTVKANSDTTNLIKVDIKHDKKPGYGFVNIRSFKIGDSANTVTVSKFSLLVSASSSIGLISKADDKLFHYFDNNIFLDKEFRNGTLEVFDIAGKMVMNSRISSDVVGFNTIPGNYIARVTLKGEVLKTLKFSTSK
jgi:hypothetical protein